MTQLQATQEAAAGFVGAQDLVRKTFESDPRAEAQAIQNLWNYYVGSHTDPVMRSVVQQARSGVMDRYIDFQAAKVQGMVWAAQQTREWNSSLAGLSREEERIIESAFNAGARAANVNKVVFANNLKNRLDPAAMDAIRNQPWWRW